MVAGAMHAGADDDPLLAMMAYFHGQVWNGAELARSLGIAGLTLAVIPQPLDPVCRASAIVCERMYEDAVVRLRVNETKRKRGEQPPPSHSADRRTGFRRNCRLLGRRLHLGAQAGTQPSATILVVCDFGEQLSASKFGEARSLHGAMRRASAKTSSAA